MENGNDSRTFIIDRLIIDGLTSDDDTYRKESLNSLPAALSKKEINDVGLQVNLSAGVNNLYLGRKLELKAIYNIADFALFDSQDLVTAENAINALIIPDLEAINKYLAMKYAARKIKKLIVGQMINSVYDQ